MCGVPGSGG